MPAIKSIIAAVLLSASSFSIAVEKQLVTGSHASVGAKHAVRLTDGQVYLGVVTGAAAGTISMRLEPWGEVQEIDRSRIAEIVFFRRDSRAVASPIPFSEGMGMLYRSGSDPVPCRLDGVSSQQVRVSSRIGQFSLPIDTVSRYVFVSYSAAIAKPSGTHEVGLTDGSIFQGRASIDGDVIQLDPKGQPSLSLKKSQVRYIRNLTSGHWLPLWKTGKAIQDGMDYSTPSAWAKGLQLSVGEVVSLPARLSGQLTLVAQVTNQTEARLIVVRGGKELKSLPLTRDLSEISIDLPAGETVTFSIESDDQSTQAVIADLFISGKGAR